MIGFAVIDNADLNEVAVWLVSRTESGEVTNTNAVVIDAQSPNFQETVRALASNRAVLLTPGATSNGLALDVATMTTDDLVPLLQEADALHARVLAAVEAYAMRPDDKTGKPRKTPLTLVAPTPPIHPHRKPFPAAGTTPETRALWTANYLCSVWSTWLDVEDQRVRRVHLASGQVRMMPEELADPNVTPLPEAFVDRLEIQPC